MKGTFLIRMMLAVVSMLTIACSNDETVQANAQSTTATGRTLVAYYSYTGNCRDIVSELTKQLQADVVEITPVDKTQKYEANGYAIGTQLLNTIKANPNDASSYPAIDPVSANLANYDNIIIVTPLWWSQMAAIMQTYLFQQSKQMEGKHVGLIVSSHSSGISGVVKDAKRLLPDVIWMGDALHISNSNRSNTSSLLQNWLQTLNFKQNDTETQTMYITIGNATQSVTLADTKAAQELAERLQNGPITVTLSSSGGFEIWGSLGFSLTSSNEQMTAKPGDVILYNGSNICIFYGSNSWSYTSIGKIDGLSESELRTFLKAGENNIQVTLSLSAETTNIENTVISDDMSDTYYTLGGVPVEYPSHGMFIKRGKKVVL